MLGANIKTKCVFFENNINSCGVRAFLMKFGEHMFIFELQLSVFVVNLAETKGCINYQKFQITVWSHANSIGTRKK